MNSHEVGYARADAAQGTHFLAATPRTLQVRELAEHVASTDAPVLITGESGVGKEVLARFIHAESGRARRSFVKINCAAVPHELLESELFFHERGAFTGAHQRKEGKFESAQGGTILVDEIGDMSLPLQAKLLHVLEDASYSRVGGNQAVRMDARVLATTNKPLKQAIADAEFRRDLYFRLKVIQIDHPAEDLEGCADEILRVPTVDRLLQPIVDVIPLQLLAYYIAVRRGADVDQPRNLVKSVTME